MMASRAMASMVEQTPIPQDQTADSLEFSDSTLASTTAPGATIYASSSTPQSVTPQQPVPSFAPANPLPPIDIQPKGGLFHNLIAKPFRLSAVFLSVLALVGGGILVVNSLGNQPSDANLSSVSTSSGDSIQTQDSKIVLNLDTELAEGKLLSVLGQLTGASTTAGNLLEVNGSIQASSTVLASNGQTSLDNTGLTINSVKVCTTAGCTSTATTTTGAVTAVDLSNLNASNLTSGTVADARLSGNVSLLGSTVDSSEIFDGTITNADINSAAAIAYAKLNLAGSVTNADLAGSIADSKLLTISTAGKVADSALSANVSLLGPSIDSAEVTNDSIINADINAAAAIDWTKINKTGSSLAELTTRSAGDLSSGTLSDARLSANVTIQGNTFNGASQLVQLDAGGLLPALNGSALTNLNASNLASGTIADARLSANVTLQGNTFNGANQLVRLDAGGLLPALNASALTNLNASNLAGGTVADARLSANVSVLGSSIDSTEITNDSIVNADINVTAAIDWTKISKTGSSLADLTTRSAGDLSSGTLADARLSSNVTLQGNSFNGASQLVQLTAGGILPVLSGANLTDLNASNLASGTIADARLSANVTLQGNTFNGASQLVQLTAGGILPVLSGANLTSLNGSNISSGTVADARLSANVTIQGNTFNGASQLVQLDAGGLLPALNGSALTTLNASNLASGTVADARLSANVSLLGQTIESAEITNDSITNTDINAAAAIDWTKISKTGSSLADLATKSAGDLSSGTLADARLSTNVTIQGNTFNGASQLVQLTAGGILPVLSGANLTSLNASNLASGTVDNARLAASVTIQGNTFNGASQLVQLDAGGLLPALNGSALTSLNASNLVSGTVADARLSANVSLLGQTIDSAEIVNDSIVNADVNSAAAIAYSKLNLGTSIVNADIAVGAAIAYSKLNLTNSVANGDLAGSIADSKLLTIATAGKVADTALSSNVALLNGTGPQTFTGNNKFTGTGLFQNAADSATAFQVQNAAGINLTQVDTTTDTANLITNGSLEVDTTGWTARGSSTISRTTSSPTPYLGLGQLKAVTTAAANDGAKYAYALASTTQYSLTGFARLDSGSAAMATFQMGRADDGSTDTSCLTAQTLVTGGWTRFTCTFTTGTTSGSPYVYFKQTDAAAHTFYLDAVKLEAAAAATPYKEGTQYLNGNIGSPTTFKNQSDSTAAFQIQNSAGTSLFTADTLNSSVSIGTLALSSTPITATGGTITTSGNYTIHTFTSSGTFTVTGGSGSVEALVVAGGGGGGGHYYSGGGGAGGMVEDWAHSVTLQAYTVTVGSGGVGGGAGGANGSPGNNSVFDTITALGGGYGAQYSAGGTNGGNGGSGGGAGSNVGGIGGSATQGDSGGGKGYGFAGGNSSNNAGAGGGGAGAVGNNAGGGLGTGGTGRANSISGSSVTYAVGGDGVASTPTNGDSGSTNRGDGGAGGGTSVAGGTGGSGIVIIRYLNTSLASTKLQVATNDSTNSSITNILTLAHTTTGTAAGANDAVYFNPDTDNSLATNLKGYWKLDETSGTRADSVNGYDLTDNNTVTSATGKVSNAGQFTSANSEYLSTTDKSDLSAGDIDFSMAAWVYLDSNTYGVIMGKGDPNAGNTYEYILQYDNGASRFMLSISASGGSGSVTANNFGAISTGTWYFVVAWHDATANTINISVNNGTADSAAWTTGANNTAYEFTIGTYPVLHTGGYFNGRIDEAGFWKKVLSSQEKTDLYNSGSGNTYGQVSAATLGIGSGILFQAENTSGSAVNTGRISSLLTTATANSEASAITLETRSTGGALSEVMRITGAGNVGIGTTGPEARLQVSGGGLCVGTDANCNTDNNSEGVVYSSSTSMTLYDVAEDYPTKDLTLTPAEIVALDETQGVFVKRANSDSDILLGVISANPAVHLGGFNGAQFADERQVAVALTGRVPVKVSGEGGSINIGDRITLSSVAGVGMKASASDQVVGIALESFNGSGTGQILVFVNLTRGSGTDLQGGNPAVDSLVVSGQLTAVDLVVSGDATIEGNLTLAGHIIGNTDTNGELIVPVGQNTATYTFIQPYESAPSLAVTPTNNPGAIRYWVTKTKNDFTIHLSAAAAEELQFDYLVQGKAP
ncbi:hypothetical protein A3F05_01735 [Candidatus Saccharibacteria bacterium RIFCSPHIGHO2_12_FULL_47_17]|nr:MAG: hypothetical protein A3F05_01735 [Candidatus Saccharibacteria bacterium RIFCSPHIGHO2_12_FULL_47_17]